MSKISNAIQMLNYLNTGNKYSVKELAEKLEITPRMVRYYKSELEQAGIPIETFMGPNGGYYLVHYGNQYPQFNKYDVELLEEVDQRLKNDQYIDIESYEKILEKDMYAWYEKTTHMCCAFFYDITQIFYIVLAGQEKQIIEADESVTQSIRKIQLFIRRHEDYWKDHVKQKIELEHRLEAML